MTEEDGYVYIREERMRKVKIPDGHVKCNACGGSGELRKYYGQPGDRGQFMTCWKCYGKGYVEKEWSEELDKTDSFFWRRGSR